MLVSNGSHLLFHARCNVFFSSITPFMNYAMLFIESLLNFYLHVLFHKINVYLFPLVHVIMWFLFLAQRYSFFPYKTLPSEYKFGIFYSNDNIENYVSILILLHHPQSFSNTKHILILINPWPRGVQHPSLMAYGQGTRSGHTNSIYSSVTPLIIMFFG